MRKRFGLSLYCSGQNFYELICILDNTVNIMWLLSLPVCFVFPVVYLCIVIHFVCLCWSFFCCVTFAIFPVTRVHNSTSVLTLYHACRPLQKLFLCICFCTVLFKHSPLLFIANKALPLSSFQEQLSFFRNVVYVSQVQWKSLTNMIGRHCWYAIVWWTKLVFLPYRVGLQETDKQYINLL